MTHDTLHHHALVIGAGIAGLCAAQAAADSFERVTVLERDDLPPGVLSRPGTPQDRHAHALLVGGQRALSELFPGFEADLEAAGAVRVRMSQDVRVERPGYAPSYPRRDLGLVQYAASRPLIEALVRRRVEQHSRVAFRHRCAATELLFSAGRQRVHGVRCRCADGSEETVAADLVIDASGRGRPTLDLLQALGQEVPQTEIGIDRGYASVTFALPAHAEPEWKGLVTQAEAPRSSRSALIYPLEGGRWILSVGGRHEEQPPSTWTGLLDYLHGLRTPTVYDVLSSACEVSEPVRFLFPASRWHHFERMPMFPTGLLPVGDAICVVNPIYGHGMSIAAQEAVLLQRLLRALPDSHDDPLGLLAPQFLAGAHALIDAPWSMAAVPDFAYPQTRGQRPADFERSTAFGRALVQLAAEDASVHALMMEVVHLLKPRSAYGEPQLLARIDALLR